MANKPRSADFAPRLTPPRSLAKPEAAIWRAVVASLSTDHFQPSDSVLLAEFCRAAHQADVAATKIAEHGAIVGEKVSPWITTQEKSQRALVALSARLRLCPQSRFDRLKAATTARSGLPDGDWSDEERDLLGVPEPPGLAYFREAAIRRNAGK